MKMLKTIIVSFFMCFIMLSFSQCCTTKQANNQETSNKMETLQEKPSFTLDSTYYQKWVAGVQGGGSGIHMYITVLSNKNHVVLDSAFFRGYKAKIEVSKMSYIAHFKTELNQKEDMIMTDKDQGEFGNKSPLKATDSSFKLTENECVISYIEDNTTKYFKIENLIEKPMEQYPSAPPKQP